VNVAGSIDDILLLGNHSVCGVVKFVNVAGSIALIFLLIKILLEFEGSHLQTAAKFVLFKFISAFK
jgi:hypothetical protein